MRCGIIAYSKVCPTPADGDIALTGVTDFDLLFTHCHYDHIIGLPSFPPLYDRGVKVTLWSGHLAGRMTTRQMVNEFMRPPWFPVTPEICKARLDYRDFVSGDVLRPREGVVVRTGSLIHPGGCMATGSNGRPRRGSDHRH
jgi:ribonuclease Z